MYEYFTKYTNTMRVFGEITVQPLHLVSFYEYHSSTICAIQTPGTQYLEWDNAVSCKNFWREMKENFELSFKTQVLYIIRSTYFTIVWSASVHRFQIDKLSLFSALGDKKYLKFAPSSFDL